MKLNNLTEEDREVILEKGKEALLSGEYVKNQNKGFVSLIGLIFALLIIGALIFALRPNLQSENTQVDNYNDAIQEAEQTKQLLEERISF